MRRNALDIVVLFVGSSLVTLYIALAQPGYRDITLRVYVLLAGTLTMLGLLAATSDSLERRRRSDFERALDERTQPDARLPGLERLERETTLATASAYDFHYRLAPHLREIATARLERRGRRFGPESLGRWWPLLDPDAPTPEERFSGGVPAADLRALVDDLERI